MKEYYNNRACEYEKIYCRDDPIRQSEQNEIVKQMKELFRNRKVLEVACGTGYWTEKIFEVTKYILALDISNEMLSIAREKNIPLSKVKFLQADAYKLEEIEGTFDDGYANFWFSHIPKLRINEFLDAFHKKIGKGSVVFMADNVYIKGIGGELITKKGELNTYKLRELSDGRKYEIIKNYYDKNELLKIFKPKAEKLKIHVGKCFWWLQYVVK